MDNREIAGLLEHLICAIRLVDRLSKFYDEFPSDDDYIKYIERAIKELREGEDEEVRFTLPDCVVTDGTTGEQ